MLNRTHERHIIATIMLHGVCLSPAKTAERIEVLFRAKTLGGKKIISWGSRLPDPPPYGEGESGGEMFPTVSYISGVRCRHHQGSFTRTPTCLSTNGKNHTCLCLCHFAFPAVAGPHLPTTKLGRKDERLSCPIAGWLHPPKHGHQPKY